MRREQEESLETGKTSEARVKPIQTDDEAEAITAKTKEQVRRIVREP
jgi:hypothetical protein